MKNLNLNLSEVNTKLVKLLNNENCVIGGSASLMAHKQLPSTYVPGGVDFCIGSMDYLKNITDFLINEGWVISLNHINSSGFNLVRQFKKGDDKIDFFIVPNLKEWSVKIEDKFFIKSELVWAARGFFAGKGWDKALNQLANNGMIRPITPKLTPIVKGEEQSITKTVKHLIKLILKRLRLWK